VIQSHILKGPVTMEHGEAGNHSTTGKTSWHTQHFCYPWADVKYKLVTKSISSDFCPVLLSFMISFKIDLWFQYICYIHLSLFRLFFFIHDSGLSQTYSVNGTNIVIVIVIKMLSS